MSSKDKDSKRRPAKKGSSSNLKESSLAPQSSKGPTAPGAAPAKATIIVDSKGAMPPSPHKDGNRSRKQSANPEGAARSRQQSANPEGAARSRQQSAAPDDGNRSRKQSTGPEGGSGSRTNSKSNLNGSTRSQTNNNNNNASVRSNGNNGSMRRPPAEAGEDPNKVAEGKGQPVRHGRRAAEEGGPAREDNSWVAGPAKGGAGPPEDKQLGQIKTINGEMDERQLQEHLKQQQALKENLMNRIAEAPAGYQAALPRLTDLDIRGTWDQLLRHVHREYDLSILTACLTQELDEDMTWNPDMLLVQLTSELLDAAEQKGEEAATFNVADESEIGNLTGGEVRKRKEVGSRGASAAPGGKAKDESGGGDKPAGRRKSSTKESDTEAATSGGGRPRSSAGHNNNNNSVNNNSKMESSTIAGGEEKSTNMSAKSSTHNLKEGKKSFSKKKK